ncbi:MAG: ATP synthase F0 subunit B [Proteobacteria bacterium]|nr:ATP synthase F0 subunit B [Pseudomonadota bacterium]
MIDFNYTLLIQFLNFLILLILLNFLLFKPVLKAINKRKKTIGSLFEKAQGIKEEADKLEKSYEEGAMERRRPILEGKDASLSDAHSTSMHIIEKARAELTEELSKVKGEVDRESRKVFDTLKMEVEKLSTGVAQKILKRSP